eukprot:GHVS01077821.1.p1 GENE.GHVS01077821.1~~GHVS01077821.1.p1  ORF type:complete len:1114 (+),score=224.37 GHVS01077821.1:346-3342(+)
MAGDSCRQQLQHPISSSSSIVNNTTSSSGCCVSTTTTDCGSTTTMWCVHIAAVNNNYWVLRCSDDNTDALQLFDIATTTARFIAAMRPLCKLLRQDAEKRLKAVNVFRELTHKYRIEQEQRNMAKGSEVEGVVCQQQEVDEIVVVGDVELDECSIVKAIIAKRQHGIDLAAPYMSSGLELEDLAVLEDAIVYFPITCAYYFKSVLYIRDLPYTGYRRRQQILEVCRDVHNVFADKQHIGTNGTTTTTRSSTTTTGILSTGNCTNATTTTTQQLTAACSTNGVGICNNKTTVKHDQSIVVVVNNNNSLLSPSTSYSTTTCSSSSATACTKLAAAPVESIAPCVWAVQCGYCVIGKGVGNTCDDAIVCMARLGCIAVFDGVGSWTHRKIDPSVFSNAMADDSHVYIQQMMASPSHCYINAGNSSFHDEASCTKLGFDSLGIDGPKQSAVVPIGTIVEVVNHRPRTHQRTKEVMSEAHRSVKRNKHEAWGSSTAVVGVVNRLTGQLGISCLGDSAIMVFRRKVVAGVSTGGGGDGLLLGRMREVVFQSDEQRWPNEAPFQLSHLPDSSKWGALRDRGMDIFVDTLELADLNGDSARDANDSRVNLEPGDLVLAMSDGVSDNLFAKEIAVLVSLAISPEEAKVMGFPERATTAMTVARGVSEAAKTRSEDPVGYHGVFQKDKSPEVTNRRRRAKLDVAGAKPDDISVVACWVTCEDTESLASIITEHQERKCQGAAAVRTAASCPVSDSCLPVSLFPKMLETEKSKCCGEKRKTLDSDCLLTEVLRRLPPAFPHLQQQTGKHQPTNNTTTTAVVTQPRPSRIPCATTTPIPRQRPLVKIAAAPTLTRKGVGLAGGVRNGNVATPVRPLRGVSRLHGNGGVRTPVVARGGGNSGTTRHVGGGIRNGGVDGNHDVVMGGSGGGGLDDIYDSAVVVATTTESPLKRPPLMLPSTPTPMGGGALRRNPARKGRPACPVLRVRGMVPAPTSEPNTPAVSDDETAVDR